jgi:hypothetical protein
VFKSPYQTFREEDLYSVFPTAELFVSSVLMEEQNEDYNPSKANVQQEFFDTQAEEQHNLACLEVRFTPFFGGAKNDLALG